MKDANEIIETAEPTHEKVQDYIREAAGFFHREEGTLFTRSEATEQLSEELGINENTAREVIAELVGDTVDPIVQIRDDGKYIGVVEFHEFDGAYGYVEYDDRFGAQKRIVCQQCVNEATFDSEVTHATAGDPSGSFDDDVDYDELLDGIHQHYERTHDVTPSEIETGATLATGTTIGGNTAWHSGNADHANLNNVTNDQHHAKTFPGIMNRAETFSESDVTVTHSKTSVVNNSVQLEDESTVSRPNDDDTFGGQDTDQGLIVSPNKDLYEITADISNNSSGYSKAYLVNHDTGTNISTKNVAGQSTVTWNHDFTSGTEYRLLLDDGYRDWGNGVYFSGPSYPFTSSHIDITNGWYSDNVRSDIAGGYNNVTGKVNNPGTVHIEWPYPDLTEWDQVLFQKTLDNETVDVYVEESADGGSTWTEIAGPLSRGDSIGASASNRVRFRVELSRADGTNTPALNAIYRRYLV